MSMTYSWGFDGSSGQSQYKQTSRKVEFDDSSLFATTIIPLQLRANTRDMRVLWQNRTPQSVRYCRPQRLAFMKESKDSILREKTSVDLEILNLQPFQVTLRSGVELCIKFELNFTVIDGKVLSIITRTPSQQSCPICCANPSQFNKIDLPFEAKQERLKFGISPLHCWIPALEFCLKLGYRNIEGLRCSRVDGVIKKQILETRKREIQQRLSTELGLNVDFPRPGGSGSSNDGNTARRAFKNQERFASILDSELWLVLDLHIILCAVSNELPLNAIKFGNFCRQLAEKYVQNYSWYYMPVRVTSDIYH